MALIGNYNDVPQLHDVVFVVEDTSLNGTYIDVTVKTFSAKPWNLLFFSYIVFSDQLL